MPCQGPTPAECAAMEVNENFRRYGVYASDLDIATRVACHLAKGESNRLTLMWTKYHNELDRKRQEREEYEAKKTKADLEIKALRDEIAARVYKKYGLPYRE